MRLFWLNVTSLATPYQSLIPVHMNQQMSWESVAKINRSQGDNYRKSPKNYNIYPKLTC